MHTVERVSEMILQSYLAHLEMKSIAFFMPILSKLSVHGLPLWEEGYIEHLIHSSWLIIWETNLTWWDDHGRDYILSILWWTKPLTYMIFKALLQQGCPFPDQLEGPKRPQMHNGQDQLGSPAISTLGICTHTTTRKGANWTRRRKTKISLLASEPMVLGLISFTNSLEDIRQTPLFSWAPLFQL